MTVSADALRELHRLHQQVAELKNRLARGPKMIRAGKAALERSEAEWNQAKEHAKRAKIESDDQNLQLKQREAKIADLQRKLNECKTNTEFSALKEQIAAEGQANSVLEDEILDKLEKIDGLNAKVAEAEQAAGKAKADLAEAERRVAEQQASLESELVRVTGELEAAETSLKGDFKTEYFRIVKARGEDALAPVEGETCGGCFTTLTPQTMNELYMSKPVFCKTCGCLLYLPEDRSVGG